MALREEVGWKVTSQPLLLLNLHYSLSRKTNDVTKATLFFSARSQSMGPGDPTSPSSDVFFFN